MTPERLRGAVANSQALVHVGLLDEGAPKLARLDEHAWSEAIRGTGGLVWSASTPFAVSQSQEERRALAATYEEWARPVRIDRLDGYSDNPALAEHLERNSLQEGEGLEALYVDTRISRSLSLTGELWSAPVKLLVGADEAQGDWWSALTFGAPLLDELSESEMMTLALRGHAVSPVTSFLAIEPGVRPSTDGLKPDEAREHRVRAPQVRWASCTVSGRAQPLDLQAFLEERLRPELARCGLSVGEGNVDLETTRNEIVRVELSPIDGAPDSLASDCFSESVWALQLPEAFGEDWGTFRVEL